MAVYSLHTDEQLLQSLRDGGEEAYTELYERYWKRMFAMAFLRLEQREQAEDVVQEVFTSLWQKREELQISSLEAWLATAVKYRVISLINRRLRREISTEELPDTPVTDVTIDYHFLERQLAQEINQLPEKCRLVFTYSRELGYSNKEIAGELQISEKAVEKHITHARKKLAVNLRSLLHSLFSLW